MLTATPCVVKHKEFGMYYFVQLQDAMEAFNMTKEDVASIVIATVTLPIRSGEPVSINVDAQRANVLNY